MCPVCRLRPPGFAITVDDKVLTVCARCAVRRGRFWQQAVMAAAVVGSILTVLEHVPLGVVTRTMATYTVPFVVSLVASLGTSKRLGTTQRRSLS